MSYNLYLDDIRQPYETGNYINPVELRSMYRLLDWVTVRNYDEFINYITNNGLPRVVSFDHDLADVHYDPTTWTERFEYQEETGHDCAKWLVNYCITHNQPLPEYYCHSMNPIGKENILNFLNNFLKFKQ